MEHDGYQFLRERAFLPETGTISFAKALNRSAIGSMNDLVYSARVLLTEDEIARFIERITDVVRPSLEALT